MEKEQKAACGSVEIHPYKHSEHLPTGVRIVCAVLHIAKPQRVFLERRGKKGKGGQGLHPEIQGHFMFSCEIPKGRWDGWVLGTHNVRQGLLGEHQFSALDALWENHLMRSSTP